MIQLESSQYPQIFVSVTGRSSLGKGKVTMTSERNFCSLSLFSKKGTNFVTICHNVNLLLKCVKRYQTISPECYVHHQSYAICPLGSLDSPLPHFHQSYLMMGNLNVQNPQPNRSQFLNMNTFTGILLMAASQMEFLSSS